MSFNHGKLWLFLAGRVLQGLGSALIQTGALGIVLDECSRADDATTEDAFASIVTANAFGAAVGPVIGGILFTLRGSEFVFLAFVVMVGVAGILVAFFVDFPDGPLPAVSFETLLTDSSTVTTAAGFSLVYCCMSLMWSTFPVHLILVFEAKEAVVGLIFTLVLLSHDIFLPIIFAFLEVRSAENRCTFVACAFIMLGVFTVLAFMAKNWYPMCAMLFAFGFSAALGMGCCSTELSERSSQNLANYHLKEAAILAGCCVGPLIGAFVDHDSLFVPYCLCALLCVLYVPAYFMKVSAAEPKGI